MQSPALPAAVDPYRTQRDGPSTSRGFVPPEDEDTERGKGAFVFKDIAMQTCIVKYNRKGDSEHVRVANFTFVKIVRTQTWTEPGKNRHASVTWPA